MKLPSIPNPKRLFRSLRGRRPRRSSSSSDASGSARSPNNGGSFNTPKSVLQPPQDGGFFAGDISQSFKLIDLDGDGKVTKDEISNLILRLYKVPPTEEELSDMLLEVEVDGDGFISLEKLRSAVAIAPPPCAAEIRGLFDFFDEDGDGRITELELLKVFECIGDDKCTAEECRMMIRGVNCNGDGFVSYEDFHRLMIEELQC